MRKVLQAMTLLGLISIFSSPVMATQESPHSVSDLQQWYCKAQDFIDEAGLVQSWLDRVKKNSIVFVNNQGVQTASPVVVAWKKTPECLINERTNEKSEKTEKSG
ncbi:hypothetical protein [Pseudidiomarina donghaiensis]|uniref:Uncharacterized protein n=1 Tax=Pseudidiomarina donghaiensis TaxID=519452 RepID=A0A432XIM4_9GAMM|nr:hypothetical protein [Pseudidiomarina donghaiensis]RUO48583.1 hypothetical protein CWE24_07335 [Pseudidiomarina donghaiensis]SFV24005.1 hypothetical protein SAMN04488139_2081 [Pseudidiomarina donghaiensis]